MKCSTKVCCIFLGGNVKAFLWTACCCQKHGHFRERNGNPFKYVYSYLKSLKKPIKNAYTNILKNTLFSELWFCGYKLFFNTAVLWTNVCVLLQWSVQQEFIVVSVRKPHWQLTPCSIDFGAQRKEFHMGREIQFEWNKFEMGCQIQGGQGNQIEPSLSRVLMLALNSNWSNLISFFVEYFAELKFHFWKLLLICVQVNVIFLTIFLTKITSLFLGNQHVFQKDKIRLMKDLLLPPIFVIIKMLIVIKTNVYNCD